MNTTTKTRTGFPCKIRSDANVGQRARHDSLRRPRHCKVSFFSENGQELPIDRSVEMAAFILLKFTAPEPDLSLQAPRLPLRRAKANLHNRAVEVSP